MVDLFLYFGCGRQETLPLRLGLCVGACGVARGNLFLFFQTGGGPLGFVKDWEGRDNANLAGEFTDGGDSGGADGGGGGKCLGWVMALTDHGFLRSVGGQVTDPVRYG